AAVLHIAAGVTREELRVSWITPRFGAPGDLELDLTAAILAGRDTGWLQRAFAGPGLATHAGARQSSMDYASVFVIEGMLADGPHADGALRVIGDALARFDGALTPEDLVRGGTAWYNEKLFGLESSLAWAGGLAGASRKRPLPSLFDGGLGDYAAVTADQVR